MISRLRAQHGSGLRETVTYLGQKYIVADPSLIPEMLQVLRDQEAVRLLRRHHRGTLSRPREAVRSGLDSVFLPPQRTHASQSHVSPTARRVPSVGSIWPAANWLEREVFDMFGIEFDGHPDMRRILMPEGGRAIRCARTTASSSRTSAGCRRTWGSKAANDRSTRYLDLNARQTFLDSTELVLNMGPQHPSTHGVLRVILKLDGEKVLGTECVIGYLHRGVEKIAENRTYAQFNPYVDRMDYVAAVSNGLGYCLAVEKLLNVEAPPRAQVHPRDPHRAEPDRQPPAVAGHARARYRRHHAGVLHASASAKRSSRSSRSTAARA